MLAGLTERDQHALKLLADQVAEHWSLDGLTTLLYGIPKLIRGLPADAPPTAELKAAQRAWFVLLYRLLIGKDTGPRLPTLLLALGEERVHVLLGA
jgi:lysyl-tRNA synthetase class 1